MDPFKLFGRRVRAVRKASKMTQEKAAERAGIAPNFLGYIERGSKRPSLEVIFALAKGLNVSADEFFQLDRVEADERVLRKKIHALVDKSNLEELQRIHSFLKYVVRP